MNKINKNIYFVRGAMHACIYNLNTNKLIHIKHNDIPLVQQLFFDPMTVNEVTQLLINEKVIVSEEDFNRNKEITLANKNIEIAWIEVNTNCNYRCIHCYVDGDTHATNVSMITLDDFKIAVDRIVDYGIKRIHFIGGEPLIHPNFWEMMMYALPKFEFSVLFTNGSLLTSQNVQELKKMGLSEVDISLYSTIKEEHEKVTLKLGSYDSALAAIKLIEEAGIICHIATIRVPGIDIGKPYTSESTNPAVQHLDYMRASGRGLSKWGEKELRLGNKAITSNIISRKVDPQKILFKMKYHNCFGKYIRINPELNVYPCTMEQRFYHGNIRFHSIADILQERIRIFNKDCIDQCNVCEFRYICSDCRPDTFSNNICEKPWFCNYNPTSGVWK